MHRLLFVEHFVTKQDKPVLYLGFEYVDTDLKRYMDTIKLTPDERLSQALIKVRIQCCMLE